MTPRSYSPPPGQQVHLADYDPDDTGGFTEDAGKVLRDELTDRLGELQDKLFADGRHAVLIVLQAMDAAGKNSTINRVFKDVGPHGCRVESFGVPTEEERAHDFLWRHHRVAPRKGHIVIFDRSHYEAVLVERVQGIVPEDVWRRRYQQINDFESLLASEGTAILKFYLHISKEEQRKQLQERIDEADKHWKFRLGDLEDRERWDDYMAAYEDAITKCNTVEAPWFVVPGNRRWYRDIVIARAIVEQLEAMELRYPPSPDPIEGVVIR